MPANLTPQYKAAEERYRSAESPREKIEALREMLAVIPKHKGTEKLQADLKQRLSKLTEQAAHARGSAARRHDPGHVEREGAGQIVLVGPPNVGKSSLLAALTHAHPEIGEYPFTTHAPLPGMMPVDDVQVQLVDTPPVTAHGFEGYLVSLVQNADGVTLVFDVGAPDALEQPAILEPLLARAHVDAARLGRVVAVANRSDLDPDGSVTALLGEALPWSVPLVRVSTRTGDGLADLRRRLYDLLGLIRVYTKEPGKKPLLERPFTLPRGSTVRDVAQAIHKDLATRLKHARIWGSARFDGQQVDREHVLADGDIVELHAG